MDYSLLLIFFKKQRTFNESEFNGGGASRRNVSMYIARDDDADEINIEDIEEPKIAKFRPNSPFTSRFDFPHND